MEQNLSAMISGKRWTRVVKISSGRRWLDSSHRIDHGRGVVPKLPDGDLARHEATSSQREL